MAKSSGSTRVSASNNPRGITNSNRTFNGWTFGTESFGSMAVRKSGKDADEIYSALSTSVEQAVESKVGDVRSGGGFTGPSDNREYTIIFREGTTFRQAENYLKEMKTGSRLFAERANAYRNGTDSEYAEADRKYMDWFNKTYRR